MDSPLARLPSALHPDAADHRHALRVAVGLLVPGIALLAAHRPELMIYAAFGSFTGMYGRGSTRRERLRDESEAGALLTAGVALGVLLVIVGAPGWVLVLVEVAFAVVCSLLADGLRLRPAGPFFFIFALGATALVPEGRTEPLTAIGICVGSVLLALALGLIVFRRRDPVERPPRRLPAGAGVHAARYALAIGAAGGVGLFFGFEHANWAMASAAVPLAAIDVGRPSDREVRLVLTRASHRTVGTFAGLVVSAVLLATGLGPSALAGMMMLLIFPTELYMTRHYAVAIGFFTPVVMLMTELAVPTDPVRLLTFRGLDTVIGVVTGVAVAVLVRGERLQRAEA